MAPADGPIAVTSKQAAAKLDKAAGTIRYWVTHYGARRLGMRGRVMLYDLRDLRVIEREIRHGHLVPRTWQERAEIRDACPTRESERLADAA
jgi:hypothetical protein